MIKLIDFCKTITQEEFSTKIGSDVLRCLNIKTNNQYVLDMIFQKMWGTDGFLLLDMSGRTFQYKIEDAEIEDFYLLEVKTIENIFEYKHE